MPVKRLLCLLSSLLLLALLCLPAAAAPVPPEISAPSAILMESSTGKILYEKEANTPLPPASVTKIMTILLVAEAIDSGRISLDDMVTASETAASMGGSQIYLEVGESMSVQDLLKAIVVASGNDAATAMAEHIAGSTEGFVALMNQKAEELGMDNTTFVNCHGLDADGHLTTAHDIALMSAELLEKHPWITDYTTIWMDSLRGGAFELANTNKLLRSYTGTTGLKTGSTDLAKYCLSASAVRGDMQLIAVVMAAPSTAERFKSAAQLLDFGFANYEKTVLPVERLAPIPVEGGTLEEVELVCIPDSVTTVLEKGDTRVVDASVTVQQSLTAPVEEGQTVGEVIFRLGETELGRGRIVTAGAVPRRSVLQQFVRYLGMLTMAD